MGTLIRLISSIFLVVALALVPTASFADDIEGGPGDDNISGTDNDDTINGNGGEDEIEAEDGDDTVNGDNDGPVVEGNDDEIEGGDGDDTVTGDGSGGLVTGGEDEIEGDDGDDSITGDGEGFIVIGGDDEIEGGDGDDSIIGDGDGFFVIGGNDEIEGDDGDDVIIGDGSTGCLFVIIFPVCGEVIGGDDVIDGGAGDDFIAGDGFEECLFIFCPTVEGGDDDLSGGEGDDVLLGQGGNDLLCGEEGTNAILGGDGIDLACAVDDETTVEEDELSIFDVGFNDEVLFDEGSGSDNGLNESDSPLIYEVVGIIGDILADFLDPNSGELIFIAEESGVVRYSVRREGNPFITFAEFVINVLGDDDDDDDDDEDSDEDSGNDSDEDSDRDSDEDSDVAALPDTGAFAGLQLIGGTGLALLTGGLGLLGATRRRPTKGESEVVSSETDIPDHEPSLASDRPAPDGRAVTGVLGVALLVIGGLAIAKSARGRKS
jgi:Ca2+-binding RTX toxin-like protein